jgi:hypothetical protein
MHAEHAPERMTSPKHHFTKQKLKNLRDLVTTTALVSTPIGLSFISVESCEKVRVSEACVEKSVFPLAL